MSKKFAAGKLVIAIIICEATGLLSGFIAGTFDNNWFNALRKPDWNPPSSVFGPVWTTLYLLMGIAPWLVWRSNSLAASGRRALFFFAIQLFLNFWWSIIFFRFHEIGIAFIIILLMIVAIITTIFLFAKVSRPAAWLLVPYISWVCFASILNYSIWHLNT